MLGTLDELTIEKVWRERLKFIIRNGKAE